jgi:hypothetical protein
MTFDYRAIGDEIFNKLGFDPARLGEALLTLNKVVRDCLESKAWNEISEHCESARELCDQIQGLEEELSDVTDPFHAEGLFHAYEGISHLYQAEEAKENKDLREMSAELAKAIHCLEKSQQSFQFFGYRDQWNAVILCVNLGKLYRSRKMLNKALLAFQESCTFSKFDRLSVEKMREIIEIVSPEIERTRILFLGLRVLEEIAAGKEEFASDEIIGYMRQTDEFEFEFKGQALKAELLGRSQLTFLTGIRLRCHAGFGR